MELARTSLWTFGSIWFGHAVRLMTQYKYNAPPDHTKTNSYILC
jgi:hypothetical protein